MPLSPSASFQSEDEGVPRSTSSDDWSFAFRPVQPSAAKSVLSSGTHPNLVRAESSRLGSGADASRDEVPDSAAARVETHHLDQPSTELAIASFPKSVSLVRRTPTNLGTNGNTRVLNWGVSCGTAVKEGATTARRSDRPGRSLERAAGSITSPSCRFFSLWVASLFVVLPRHKPTFPRQLCNRRVGRPCYYSCRASARKWRVLPTVQCR